MRRNGIGLQHVVNRSLEHHLAAFPASLRTDVHDVVGIEHHVAVVLHDDDRVAQVAQFLQRTDESVVIPLMQSYRRLVQDIEHVDQLRTYLCGKADALTLTA